MSTSDERSKTSVDSRTLRVVQNLNLIPDIVAGARYTGIHSSTDRGGDVEFAEHRQYEPGDDLRHLDWNALAKTDELFLKQYESETQITGHVVLDGSKSMDFGTDRINKWALGKALTTLFSSTLLNQQDRVQILLSQSETWSSGILGEFHDLKKQTIQLDQKQPRGGTKLLQDIRSSQGDGQKFWTIVSDFWLEDLSSFFQWMRALKEREHDAILAPVWDPLERAFPIEDAVELQDIETGETLHVGPDSRETFEEALRERRNSLETYAREIGITFWPFYTDRSLFETYRTYALKTFN